MKYCPKCRNPVAKAVSQCPDCGHSFDSKPRLIHREAAGKDAEVDVSPARAAPEFGAGERDIDFGDSTDGAALDLASLAPGDPTAPAAAAGYGMEDIDLESGGGASGLNLASLPPGDLLKHRADPLAGLLPAPIEDIEVHSTARFGAPGAGPHGLVLYWWKVRQRSAEIEAELASATAAASTAVELREKTKAALGRLGHKVGVTSESLTDLMETALELVGDRKRLERRRYGAQASHREKLAPLEEKRAGLEEAGAPLETALGEARERHREMLHARSRAEAEKQRAEIELRNVRELIARKQEAYSDLERPEEERERLLDEIADLDRSKPAIKERVKDADAALSDMEAPLAELARVVDERKREYRVELDRIAEVDREIEAVTREFSQRAGSLSADLVKLRERVERAWAAVGNQIVLEQIAPEALEGPLTQATDAMSEAVRAERAVELWTRCRTAYDAAAVDKGKKILFGAGAGLFALIVLLLVLT